MADNNAQTTATVFQFADFKKQQQPELAATFCDNRSLNESIEALADRVFDQWYNSVRVNRRIDENEAEITEAIVDSIRAEYHIPTDAITHKVEVGFNIRLTQFEQRSATA